MLTARGVRQLAYRRFAVPKRLVAMVAAAKKRVVAIVTGNDWECHRVLDALQDSSVLAAVADELPKPLARKLSAVEQDPERMKRLHVHSARLQYQFPLVEAQVWCLADLLADAGPSGASMNTQQHATLLKAHLPDLDKVLQFVQFAVLFVFPERAVFFAFGKTRL